MADSALFKSIKPVLDFVWNSQYSSFYRDKYKASLSLRDKKVGINNLKNINSMADFQKLPYLTREELINTEPFKRFFLPLQKAKSFNISSGSSSGKRLIMLSSNDRNPRLSKLTEQARQLGVTSCMFLNSPTAFQQLVKVPEVQHKSINKYLGDIYNLPLTAKLMAKLQVDAMSIVPSYLSIFIPILEKEYDLKKIKYILMGGEYCSAQRMAFFRKKFPNAFIKRKFASTEAGGIGNQCIYLHQDSPQIFHPLPQLFYEFINFEQESEMVLTHLRVPREFPLIRYKTGDMVKNIKEKCACGQKSMFRILGRIGIDVIKLKDMYIYPEAIDNLVASMKDHLDISNWKLHIFDNQGKKGLSRLHLQVKLNRKYQNEEQISKAIYKKMNQSLYFNSDDNLESLVKRGKFAPLKIEFVPEFEFAPPKNRNIIYHEK